MKYLLLTIALLLFSALSFAQSPDFGNAYNSKTGKKDMCIKMLSEDGVTVESKRCKELRITDRYFSEEEDYFLIKAGIGVSGVSTAASDNNAISNLHAHVEKTISSDPAFSSGTLANGIAGQTTTIEIVGNDGNLSWTLTPATSTGFTSITFFKTGDYVTLLYLDDVAGWIIFSRSGVQVDSRTKITRLTNSDDPYTVLASDENIFADTDNSGIVVPLPAGS